jgi:hypothetical protein
MSIYILYSQKKRLCGIGVLKSFLFGSLVLVRMVVGATRDGLLKQLTFCLFIYINYSETEILCQHFS